MPSATDNRAIAAGILGFILGSRGNGAKRRVVGGTAGFGAAWSLAIALSPRRAS